MNGFEVLAQLKTEPALRRIPVVMFTTSDSQEDIDRAYALGACSFITKPSSLEELDTTFRRLAGYWVATARLPLPPVTLAEVK
jgi:CheY-like chemotaxis protein